MATTKEEKDEQAFFAGVVKQQEKDERKEEMEKHKEAKHDKTESDKKDKDVNPLAAPAPETVDREKETQRLWEEDEKRHKDQGSKEAV